MGREYYSANSRTRSDASTALAATSTSMDVRLHAHMSCLSADSARACSRSSNRPASISTSGGGDQCMRSSESAGHAIALSASGNLGTSPHF